jgi:hypothetical protein
MHQPNQVSPLILNGIDAGNPLGFLAALGAAILATSFCRDTRFFWCLERGAWRPALHGCGTDKARFIEQLFAAIKAASMRPFEIDNKLPFPVGLFEISLKDAQQAASPMNRRMADFLAGFGSELYPKNEVFQNSRFRMGRSGDPVGQGLSAYARVIRRITSESNLHKALFLPWTYKDIFYEESDEGKKKKKPIPNFRWDPIDDRRYALRWRNPDQKTDGDIGTELGANSLAIEALQLYPTMFDGNRLATTGFHRNSNKEVWFSWPIWDHPVSLDAVRSLLAFSELHSAQPPRGQLAKRGIVEVYRSQRIQPSKYYSNFTMGRPA